MTDVSELIATVNYMLKLVLISLRENELGVRKQKKRRKRILQSLQRSMPRNFFPVKSCCCKVGCQNAATKCQDDTGVRSPLGTD